MTTSALIPIPNSDTEFEDNCEILAKEVFNDPNASTFAEKGYKQYGIDILGYRDQDSNRVLGVQCKLKTKGDPPTEAEIRGELTKLEEFSEELESYYVWHTTNDSTELENLAVTLTKEFASAGKRTTVHIWGWRKLSNLISRYPDALRAFSPDHTVATDEILRRLAEQTSSTSQLDSKISAVQEFMARIEKQFQASDTSLDSEDLGAFHKVIDQYADLLRNGKAQTALDLLRDLESSFTSQTPGRVRFRVRANIGHALIRLGSTDEGCQALEEAVQFEPNTAKAWETRAIAAANLDKPDDAVKLVRDGLEAFPGDSGLISLLLRLGTDDPDLGDPWSIVPAELVATPEIVFAVLTFQRERGNSAWRELAKSGADQHKESKSLALASAEAVLEESIEKYERQLQIPDDKELVRATEYLSEVHEAAYASEERTFPNNLIVGCNLITAHRILGQFEAAGRIVDQLLPYADEHPYIIESSVPVLSALGRYDECKDLIDSLPRGRERVMASIETFLALGEFTELIQSVNESSIEDLSEDDQARARGAIMLARDAQDSNDISVDDIRGLADSAPTVVDTQAISANLLFRKGEVEEANAKFEYALGLITDGSPRPDRYNLARVAEQLDRWDDVITLLDGYLFTDSESEESIRLAHAFIQVPKHAGAVAFFDELVGAVPTARVIRMASHHAFNQGDLDRTQTFIDMLLAIDEFDAEAYVLGVSILNRADRLDEVPGLITNLDLNRINGSVGSRLSLSAVCVRHGRAKDGFELAYKTTLKNLDDAKVTQFYATLCFVMEAELKIVSSELDTVVEESWVEYISEDGPHGVLLTAGASQRAHDIFNAAEDRARPLLGAKPGDIVELPASRRETSQVEVTAVFDRFPGLLRSILRNFDDRYSSGSDGMYSVQTKEGDIQPLLDEIRELSEAELETARIYTEGVVPMFVVATRVRGNQIDFAGYLAAHDLDIITCIGTAEERESAFRSIRAGEGKGVVLDTYTFWVACELRVFDHVKDYFGTVFVTQSTVDDLISYREQRRPVGDGPLMTVGYKDGEYFREEVDAKKLQEFVDLVSERIGIAQDKCTVVAAQRPAELDSTDFQFLDRDGGQDLDPIYLAISESAHLLSDDLRYRQLAQGLGTSDSSWLQVLLLSLNGAGKLNNDEYADILVSLAARRHRYVSIRAENLFALARRDQKPSDQFRLLAKQIGSTDAEIRSHVGVIVEFGIKIDDENDLGVTRFAYLGILLEEIIKHRNDDWSRVLDAIRYLFVRAGWNRLAEYIDGWRAGHFLG